MVTVDWNPPNQRFEPKKEPFRARVSGSHCDLYIHIQILQTDLPTFPPRISWENLVKDQSIFSFLIIFLVLITFSLTCEVIIVRRKFMLITLGTERVKIQTSLLINLLVLHTGTTTGSVKGSKFFPDLSAARQKAQRRWVNMYLLFDWVGRQDRKILGLRSPVFESENTVETLFVANYFIPYTMVPSALALWILLSV